MARFLRTALLALVVLFSVPVVVHAQLSGPDYDKNQIEEYKAAIESCDTPSLECLVHYTSRYIAIEWLTQTVGDACGDVTCYVTSETDPTGAGGNAPTDQSTDATIPGTQNARRQGVIGSINYLITQMYVNQPADTATFIADVANSAGFAQPAYAQGLGFAALNPVLDLWKVFRNIAYTFFVVVFIVIGFMIMFRTKISGNAAVTAQQAIPSIIMSLIFVTFSYAIAGFLIDMMYLSMFLILGIFGDTLRTESGTEIINYNILTLAGKLFTATGFSGEAFDRNLNAVEVFLNSFTDNPLLNNGAVEFIGGLLVSLVVAIAALIATFKLFFELLKSYASIIINVVMAPVLLMVGAIPGRNAFTPWVKNLIGNLIAFPTVLLVLVIFYQFVGATGQQRFEEGGFMPPFLLGRGQPDIIATLMGFALLLALPEVVKKAKESFGAKSGFGEMVTGAAWGRAKQAWDGKMPFGMNAKNIAGAGMGLGLTTAGAATGGVIGGAMAVRKSGKLSDFRKGMTSGAVKGGLIGGGVGLLAPRAPQIISSVTKVAGQQVAQGAAEWIIGDKMDEFRHRQARQKTEDINKGVNNSETAKNTTVESGTTVSNTPKPNVTSKGTPF